MSQGARGSVKMSQGSVHIEENTSEDESRGQWKDEDGKAGENH